MIQRLLQALIYNSSGHVTRNITRLGALKARHGLLRIARSHRGALGHFGYWALTRMPLTHDILYEVASIEGQITREEDSHASSSDSLRT